MVQPVSTGEWGVITDISFQRGARDIKVARGNHYSDIVRSSLFRKSSRSFFLVSSLFPCLFSFPFLPVSPLSPLFSALSFSLSHLYPAVFSNISLPLKRKATKDEGRHGLLIRIPRSRRRHLVANPFRSRRIFTRTRPRNRDESCVPIARIST